ncbi:MAG: hypothetical protein NDF51_03330 [archaeon YNP-WB-040]|nr:hypothetical protein [Candidatus Culexarchaeum yellowstonense]
MSSKRLFGTSGVRGEINRILTPELTVKLSMAFSKFLGGSGDIAIGFDSRFPSRVLAEACVSGALFSGLNVYYVGLVPTPVLLHLVKVFRLDGAIMVSASHTPPKFCGIMFFKGDTGELSPSESNIIEGFLESNLQFSGGIGRLEYLHDICELYVDSVIGGFGSIGGVGGFRVVGDMGNSAYAPYLQVLFDRLGVELIDVNSHPDGFFPGRGADVNASSLRDVSNMIVNGVGDFGFGVDGDGDRCIFVDENGCVVSGDLTGALFSREILLNTGGGVIVCPINTSNLIIDVSREFNGRVHFTRVGPPEIVEAVRRVNGVVFAFEESGKYIWPQNILYGDPGYAILYMLKLISKYGSIVNAIRDFPKYFQFKVAIPCADEYKWLTLKSVREKLLTMVQPREIIDVDGLKVIFDEGWILLRPSGTEDVFRVFVESLDEGWASKMFDLCVGLVKDVIKNLSK